MIGLPYIAGGISKDYIVEAAEEVNLGWVAWMFYASMVLNAVYYLPISYRTLIKKADVKVKQALPQSMKLAISITAGLTLLYAAYYGLVLEVLKIDG
jgi:formate hydrogenlyase subunit 3/multisubunit Na+/H+ antiporter MnhD subunit